MTRTLRPYQPKARYIPRNRKTEESVQRKAARFLQLQWAGIIFRSDYASGLRLTMYQAVTHKALQSSRAFPDLFIYKSMTIDGRHYCGAAFELKKDGVTIIVKIGPRKGELVADPHVREQYLMLQELEKAGYYTDFCIGFDEFVRKSNWYLSGGKKPLENTELF